MLVVLVLGEQTYEYTTGYWCSELRRGCVILAPSHRSRSGDLSCHLPTLKFSSMSAQHRLSIMPLIREAAAGGHDEMARQAISK